MQLLSWGESWHEMQKSNFWKRKQALTFHAKFLSRIQFDEMTKPIFLEKNQIVVCRNFYPAR